MSVTYPLNPVLLLTSMVINAEVSMTSVGIVQLLMAMISH